MNNIEKKFMQKVIKRAGINLYKKQDACEFIIACEKDNIKILGIDGFILTEATTQPSLENSIDLSTFLFSNENLYNEAIEFMKDRDENLYFEIIIDN